jgi:hypothetical protein
MKKNYVAPKMERVEMEIEAPIAASAPSIVGSQSTWEKP